MSAIETDPAGTAPFRLVKCSRIARERSWAQVESGRVSPAGARLRSASAYDLWRRER